MVVTPHEKTHYSYRVAKVLDFIQRLGRYLDPNNHLDSYYSDFSYIMPENQCCSSHFVFSFESYLSNLVILVSLNNYLKKVTFSNGYSF